MWISNIDFFIFQITSMFSITFCFKDDMLIARFEDITQLEIGIAQAKTVKSTQMKVNFYYEVHVGDKDLFICWQGCASLHELAQ